MADSTLSYSVCVCVSEIVREKERMSKMGQLVTARSIKRVPSCYPMKTSRRYKFLPHTSKLVVAASRRNDFTLINKKGWRTPRRLITISTGDGRWHGKWTCDYLLSLQDLSLEDLIEDDQKDAEVSIHLCIHKHASFGFSVDGRIITSFPRKCSICSSPFCRKIDTNFNVWVLPSSRDNRAVQLPEIGGDDPSVIYVKPGCEANLDSLIQETIRLTISVKDTCSESCEKSEPTIQFPGIGRQKSASVDKRWSRLLELKKSNV